MQTDWAYQELYRVPLWDPRCRRSLVCACEALAQNAESSFSRALGSRRKAVSRILHHESVTAQDLLRGHIQATVSRCQEHALVLVASDTTLADFSSQKALTGLGPLAASPGSAGFLVHSALAMTPAGLPLGRLHQHSWVREADPTAPVKNRTRAFADKESHKWLDALRGVEAALPADQPALLLQDREADVYAFFAAPRRPKLDLLMRATQPRRVEVAATQGPTSLFAAVSAGAFATTLTVALRAQPGRAAREAVLGVRWQTVAVLAPRHGKDAPCAQVNLTVLQAVETAPPAGVEPVDWVLLTTWDVTDADAACWLVTSYSRRWLIERFHFVLKSGCRLERLQLDTYTLLAKALRLYSIVAWRLLYVTYLGRHVPDMPAEQVVSYRERQVLERTTGHPVNTVREALLAVARIAGFVGVPSAPDPGVKSLWLGFRKLQEMLAGFLLASQPPP